jgi:Beta-lactamase class D
MMLQEQNEQYKLYYKTGTSTTHDAKINVWIVGFLERIESQKNVLSKLPETNYRPYFFAMNFETGDTTMNIQEVRVRILKELLKERGIID